jgi:hypothetical protein
MNHPAKMNGQWIGTYTVGDATGRIHVNIDEVESGYLGMAYVFDADPKLPTAVAYFATPSKEREFSFRTDPIQAVDPQTGNAVPWESVKSKFPEGTAFSSYADVRGSFDHASLTLSWITDTGLSGTCVLPRSKADEPSELVPLEQDWNTFKAFGIKEASK